MWFFMGKLCQKEKFKILKRSDFGGFPSPEVREKTTIVIFL
jgi:hypothetical protein